jgi:alpha-amylase/alpha-mannosidase (GH57 family)
MERYICIHGHFYQPPRENPWLEEIELQNSAYPYHDWNERITAECYAPNGTSRILDDANRITQIVNNYAKISFNFGPTLLAWLEANAPLVYRAVLDADRESQKIFSAHGSALAQAYNHMILPLANRRDKYTQVLWGIRDFEYRFGRAPEGMWLPETAVDLETLDILAEFGIRFTILAPYQASRVRPLGGRHWRDVSGGRLDPTMAYVQRLPSGRRITVFFYDGPISRAVAFEGLLSDGEHFAQRLLSGFSDARTGPYQLVHIATDGETYGHHRHHGDMALAYALRHIETNHLARLTNYGEVLEKHRPAHLVEIYEQTSWSCGHGIERWRSNCGCHSGMHPGWSQAWRAPLREALDWLRDTLAPKYEQRARTLLIDPWAARDDYITVILDRSPQSLQHFLSKHAVTALTAAERVTVLKLLELQRHAMLMYTSCGWFFDELSGIETVQVLQYAGRAIQLAQELFGDAVEALFLEKLEPAKSNLAAHQDGRHIYGKLVKPAMVDWEKIGAHYAVSSVFESYPERARLFCYTAEREDFQGVEAGRAKLIVGRVRLTSDITHESADLSFGALHFGDHNVSGGVQHFQGDEVYRTTVNEMTAAFAKADFAEVIRLLDRHFGESTYSLKSLFRDNQRKVLNRILESTLAEAEAAYRQIYEHHAPMMRFLNDLSMPLNDLSVPLPNAFQMATSFILNIDLRRAFEADAPNLNRVRTLLEEARLWRVELDTAGLGFALQKTLERIIEQLWTSPTDLSRLVALRASADLIRSLPFELNLWKVQNIYYDLLQRIYPDVLDKADQEDEAAQTWVEHFLTLGEALLIRVE